MPEKVDEIHSALMQDPDFESLPGKTKEESAWAVAWSRYKQMQKNVAALSLGKAEIPVGDIHPSEQDDDNYRNGDEYEHCVHCECECEICLEHKNDEKLEKHVTGAFHQHPDKTGKLTGHTPSGHVAFVHPSTKKPFSVFKRYLSKTIKDPYAVATQVAQKMGHEDFSEGSSGVKKRDEIAEALKSTHKALNSSPGNSYGYPTLSGYEHEQKPSMKKDWPGMAFGKKPPPQSKLSKKPNYGKIKFGIRKEHQGDTPHNVKSASGGYGFGAPQKKQIDMNKPDAKPFIDMSGHK